MSLDKHTSRPPAKEKAARVIELVKEHSMPTPGTSVHPDTTGAPRSWRSREQFIQLSRDSIRTLGPAGAIIFELIDFRAQINPDGWKATYADIADATGVPAGTVRDQLGRLRERGYVGCRRASAYDATLVWWPIWEGDGSPRPEVTDSSTSEMRDPSISSSSKKGKEHPPSHSPHVDPPSAVVEPVESETPEDHEIQELCQAMADHARRLGARGQITTADHRAARQLLTDPDFGGIAGVWRVLDYAAHDPFWAPKVTTVRALLRKWEQLAPRANDPAPPPAPRRADIDWDLAMRQAAAVDAGEPVPGGPLGISL